MSDQAAFKACYADWKLIRTRSVVQVVLEIPLEAAGQAYDVLGGMPNPGAETWCAIARLKGKEGKSNPLTDTPAPASVEASPVRARTWAEITPAQQALDDLAPLGLGLIVVSTLLIIMAARTARHLDFSCRPQDRNSITGEPTCRLPAGDNTTVPASRREP